MTVQWFVQAALIAGVVAGAVVAIGFGFHKLARPTRISFAARAAAVTGTRRIPRVDPSSSVPNSLVLQMARSFSEEALRVARSLVRTDSLEALLREAASNLTVEDFRKKQLFVGTAGAIGGLTAGAGLATIGTPLPTIAMMGLCAGLGAVIGFYLPLSEVRTRAKRRQRAILDSLDDVADLLQLLLSIGYPDESAMVAVATSGTGPLPELFGQIVSAAKSAPPGTVGVLPGQLRAASREASNPLVAQFLLGYASEIEQGSTEKIRRMAALAKDVRDRREDDIEATGERRTNLIFAVSLIAFGWAIFVPMLANVTLMTKGILGG